jgi:uncharacterized protein (TIRG00374 family)
VRMRLAVDLGAAVAPTAAGGEAFKWGLLVQYGVRPGPAAALAIMLKLEDAVFFLIARPVAIVWSRAWQLPAVIASGRALTGNAITVVLIATAVALITWFVVRFVLRGGAGARARRRGLVWWGTFRRRFRRSWREAIGVFALIARRGKARLAGTLLLTAIQWGARYSVVSAFALFLGIDFDPVLFWVLQWVVFTIMSFIPTPGATGAAEVAFTAVYASLLPPGTIGIATAGWRMFTFYAPVLLAALLFPLLAPRARSPVAPDAAKLSA